VLACRRNFTIQVPETAVALTATLLKVRHWLGGPRNRTCAAIVCCFTKAMR
jgi:hypothetical protein